MSFELPPALLEQVEELAAIVDELVIAGNAEA